MHIEMQEGIGKDHTLTQETIQYVTTLGLRPEIVWQSGVILIRILPGTAPLENAQVQCLENRPGVAKIIPALGF